MIASLFDGRRKALRCRYPLRGAQGLHPNAAIMRRGAAVRRDSDHVSVRFSTAQVRRTERTSTRSVGCLMFQLPIAPIVCSGVVKTSECG
jgi:hypothetical protein